jgi:hypothetical protein
MVRMLGAAGAGSAGGTRGPVSAGCVEPTAAEQGEPTVSA